MTPLVRFLLLNLAGGFAIGILAGLIFIHLSIELFMYQPIAIFLLLWSFGASFGVGAVGNGLAFLACK